MKLLAIDFETANSSSASACSIGYALWDEGEIVKREEILIKPHPSVDYFYYFNTQIHGITKEMVEQEDQWPEVFEKIKDNFVDSVVCAHNAPFDMGVLRSINTLYGIKMNPFYYMDTVRLSQLMYPQLRNHKLNTMCDYLDFDLNHHHAGSDALGCLAIVLDAMDQFGIYEPLELVKALKLPYREFK